MLSLYLSARLSPGCVFVSASRCLHRRHCASCLPWVGKRMARRLVRSDPNSHSECCWHSLVVLGSPGPLSLRVHQSRWRRRRQFRRLVHLHRSRCSMAGLGSPPLWIGSQTNQFNCSDRSSCELEEVTERRMTRARAKQKSNEKQLIGCTHFAIF